jgi:diacylglycerol kinase (ATP)
MGLAREELAVSTIDVLMRKAALLFNPLSGRRTRRRLADVDEALSVLHEAGVEAFAEPTSAAGGAVGQVQQAIQQECDTIFACGGDGTIHDVLQGIVGTDAAMGIIPFGTANSLAHDLKIPSSPRAAATAALSAKVKRIAAGRIEYQDLANHRASRYFTVTAGIGVDAHLFYQLNPAMKSRFGMAAYYLNATRLWVSHPMEEFEVVLTEGGNLRALAVSQLLAVRIRNFGGMLRELAPGASLERNDFRIVLFRTRKRLAYFQYVMRGIIARPASIRGIEAVHGERIECRSISDKSRVFVEADGELLGTLPAEITVVPDAFRLLMPNVG